MNKSVNVSANNFMIPSNGKTAQKTVSLSLERFTDIRVAVNKSSPVPKRKDLRIQADVSIQSLTIKFE